MSHFNVLVIGGDVERQLAPYHEFECTGTVNEFVKNVDITAEARETYNSDTTRRLRDPDGVLHEPYDDRFYRDPTPEEVGKIGPLGGSGCGNGIVWHYKDWGDGRGYRAKVRFVPDGWAEVEVPTRDVQLFAEFVGHYYGLTPAPYETVDPWGGKWNKIDIEGRHKYGYIRLGPGGDVIEAIDRTNPEAHWDWWVVGGRWGGMLKVRPAAERKGPVDETSPGYADEALLCDVDLDGMRAEAGARAAERFDKFAPAFAGRTIPSWTEILDRHGVANIEAARAEHKADPVTQALVEIDHWITYDAGDLRDYFCAGDREAFIARARDAALVPFAIVKDGKWFERGEMGWWGCVSNEMDLGEWSRRVAGLLADIPGETMISVVDCHI